MTGTRTRTGTHASAQAGGRAARRDEYVATEAGAVKLPPSARTLRQRVAWLVRRGYVWGAYLLAVHSNKVVMGMLQRAHPDVPWKNMQLAWKRSGIR